MHMFAQKPKEDKLSRQLNDILPGRVGLLAHIDRTLMLIDIFGIDLLRRHVALIHANIAARQLVGNHGVPGIVALYDTRSGTQLDVPAARRALTRLRTRYQRNSLEQLRLRPRREAPATYWFQDPASQQSSSSTAGGGIMTTGQLRARVFIEPQELISGQIAALTARVFVNLQDVGNPSRLQAAIRMPLLMLRGGLLPGKRGILQVPAASQAVLKRTLLHEALHSMLIRQSSNANAVWQANHTQLTVQGSPSAVPKFVELVRKYLIAYEEVFVYENVASLYPPVWKTKAEYDLFIKGVEGFLRRRSLTLNTLSRSIPVRQRVAGRNVTWTIIYKVPSGNVNLTVFDISSLDLLLRVYPMSWD